MLSFESNGLARFAKLIQTAPFKDKIDELKIDIEIEPAIYPTTEGESEGEGEEEKKETPLSGEQQAVLEKFQNTFFYNVTRILNKEDDKWRDLFVGGNFAECLKSTNDANTIDENLEIMFRNCNNECFLAQNNSLQTITYLHEVAQLDPKMLFFLFKREQPAMKLYIQYHEADFEKFKLLEKTTTVEEFWALASKNISPATSAGRIISLFEDRMLERGENNAMNVSTFYAACTKALNSDTKIKGEFKGVLDREMRTYNLSRTATDEEDIDLLFSSKDDKFKEKQINKAIEQAKAYIERNPQPSVYDLFSLLKCEGVAALYDPRAETFEELLIALKRNNKPLHHTIQLFGNANPDFVASQVIKLVYAHNKEFLTFTK